MKDLKLNAAGDLDISNFDFAITNDLGQKLRQHLRLFKGEWFLNLDAGIPYFEDILGKKNALNIIESKFVQAISAIEEVAEILKLNLSIDSKTRTLKVNVTVRGIDNNIVEEVIEL